jgi:hypothetical protein
MGRLDSGALQASGENRVAARRQGTMARAKPVASPGASVGGSWRPWLVTIAAVLGAMVLIAGISHMAAKSDSPSIALSDR